MKTSRTLVEGLKATPATIDPALEKQFVYTPKPGVEALQKGQARKQSEIHRRSQMSTRIRTDYAELLKRASLERQLSGQEPHTLQDILEEAIGPWLRENGYTE